MTPSRKRITLLLLLSVGLFFLQPQSVIAQGGQIQRAPAAGGGGGVNLSDYFVLGKGGGKVADAYSTPADIVNVLAKNLLAISGLLLLLILVFAGFKYVYQGKKGAEEARTIITVAVIGFLIMFAAYWIVQILEVVTGVQIPI